MAQNLSTDGSLWLLAGLFAVAGTLHFIIPKKYIQIVPRSLPWRSALVIVSGACELLGAVGLLVPATRQAAGWGLIVLLAAVFPANVKMLQDAQASEAPGWRRLLLWLRLPLQPLLMGWVFRVACCTN